jgi:PTH1 family peptidyl-tRNA hydrolase
MNPLRLIVGLGNPGPEHLRNRHNAGFWFLDAFARALECRLGVERKLHAETGRARLDGCDLLLLKPTTYMNNSGRALIAAWNYYKIEPEETLIAHDDLDLPPGTVRLKFDGGHGGQNGLRDIIQQLGHARFHRLRFGIGHPGHKDQVTPWVLGRAGKADEEAIIGSVGEALEVMPLVVNGDLERAMTRLHTRDAGMGNRES